MAVIGDGNIDLGAGVIHSTAGASEGLSIRMSLVPVPQAARTREVELPKEIRSIC
ncbi:hypothetical protein ACPOL_0884 [Acidisarcina polymorpha]|uniref:Uncharacterized protein n=1 Tax=Acidisarcina polymorpha TaxID=2211140 RepID=A0A2Z5FTS5_9BACT|nr:hypothetical protein [Acidisarcina polymorpha]AXC10241.1 hypothetical protein ACPOL_0884 [Acidisarcina polymorpha]